MPSIRSFRNGSFACRSYSGARPDYADPGRTGAAAPGSRAQPTAPQHQSGLWPFRLALLFALAVLWEMSMRCVSGKSELEQQVSDSGPR